MKEVKARGLGTLMGLVISLILGVMTMRSCQSTSPSSPSNPANVARNGVAGVCANSQAVGDAGSPDDPAPQVTLPPDLAAKLHKAAPKLENVVSQATNCTTTTTSP
jgi:hypothetical protein